MAEVASHAALREALRHVIADAEARLRGLQASVEALPAPPDTDDNATRASPLATVRGALLETTRAVASALQALGERAAADSLAVLVSGLLKSGKSSLVNALLGALCCPTRDEAATSMLLTAVADPARGDFALETASGRALERGGPRAMQARIQGINEELRTRDAGDSDEAELLLNTPAQAYTRDGLSLRLMDSPGVNEDLSPNIRTRWHQALASADVLLVVVPYSPCGSGDEGQFWRQLARELPGRATQSVLLFINKYDQASVDDGDNDAHRARTKQARIEYVRQATNGRITLAPEQVFVGCARDAMAARAILEMPIGGDLDVDAFQEEFGSLITLVRRAFRTRADLSSARALLSVEDWESVLQASGFAELDALLRARARVCAVAHVRKLLLVTQVNSARIRQMTQLFAADLDASESAATTRLADVASAERLVETFFAEEAQAEDALYCLQLRQALDHLSARLRVGLDEIRRGSSFDAFPERLEVSDNGQLVQLLHAFRDKAHDVVDQEQDAFRERIRALALRRQGLRRSYFVRVDQILADHGIIRPSHLLLGEGEGEIDEGQEAEDAVAHSIDRSLSWIEGFVHLNTDQLVRNANREVQTELTGAAQFHEAGDFRSNPTGDARLSGRWIWHGQTCKMGFGNQFVAKVQVDAAFVGQPVTLELEHLTSNVGDHSRAAVTVTINGTAVRTAFDPRAAHEVGNNKVGLFSYVTDRWYVAPDCIRAGENVLQIAYAEGTSLYWLKHWALSATVPAAERQFVSREAVLTTTLASALEGLVRGDRHRGEFDEILTLTSPLTAQRAASERCMQLLRELAETTRHGRESCAETRAALAQIEAQCGELEDAMVDAVLRLARLANTIQQEVEAVD